MSVKLCPSCGKPSKTGMKYCMYCGTSLEKKDDWFNEGKKADWYPEEKKEIPKIEPPPAPVKEPVEVDEIPEDIKTQLELRSKLEEIIGETSNLTGDIDKLMEGLSGEISIEDYKNKIKALKNRVIELKKEREEVEKLIKPLPLEQLLRQREGLKDRLEKLKEVYKSKEITNETFEKLRKEYESEFDEIKKKHRIEKDRVENWIADLERDRKKNQEELELLYARYKTGEVNENEYQKNKEELKKELKKTQVSLENFRVEMRQWG
ncbi:MAG: zinc-ribbon domain-containing protein [Candidatus Freyarchaeum deiterrae]